MEEMESEWPKRSSRHGKEQAVASATDGQPWEQMKGDLHGMARSREGASLGEGTVGAQGLKQKGLAVFEEQGGGNAGRQRPEHLEALWYNGKSTKAGYTATA